MRLNTDYYKANGETGSRRASSPSSITGPFSAAVFPISAAAFCCDTPEPMLHTKATHFCHV